MGDEKQNRHYFINIAGNKNAVASVKNKNASDENQNRHCVINIAGAGGR